MKYSGMVIFPKAKINIGLRIKGKRQDGFHDLETIFYPVNFCDALEFVVPEEYAGADIFTITGLPVSGDPADNLVIKALNRMREFCTVPFLKIHLHKMIPTGAGLGGGSSDAASFLKVLNRYFCFKLDDQELKNVALSLGSDCPFFIDSQPSYAEGRGEIFTPIDRLPGGLFIVIVKPEAGIKTREAFQECTPSVSNTKLTELVRLDIGEWRNNIVNDFERSIFRHHPEIRELKEALYESGAIYSSLTGSGSAVYGIYKTHPEIPVKLRKYLIYSDLL